MNQIKMGNRVVIIAGTASTNEKTRYREANQERPTPRRIVVIRNGELVGSSSGR